MTEQNAALNPTVLMVRECMEGIPSVTLPEGFSVRSIGIRDVPLWLDIWRDVEPPDVISDDLMETLRTLGHNRLPRQKFRVPAIRLYLSFGFNPEIDTGGQAFKDLGVK